MSEPTRPKSWKTRNPTKIISADNGLLQNLEYLNGASALLITSRSHMTNGTISELCDSLSNKTFRILNNISPNPTASEIAKTIANLSSINCETVVAIGGGSVIDTAKIISLYLNSGLSPSREDLLGFKSEIQIKSNCQLVAVPTTAGTGAEVTQFATIWDDLTNRKHSVSSSQLFPDIAILDPTLLKTMSPDLALFSCLDASAHCLETLWNRNRTTESETLARQGINLISKHFAMLKNYVWSRDSARDFQTAATYGGLAISISKTALSHSISYPLTAHLKIPHGLAVGFTLVAIFELFSDNEREFVEKGQNIKKLINSIKDANLGSKILKYTSKRQVYDLIPEMFSPNRAKNFIQPVDSTLIELIIARSLK